MFARCPALSRQCSCPTKMYACLRFGKEGGCKLVPVNARAKPRRILDWFCGRYAYLTSASSAHDARSEAMPECCKGRPDRGHRCPFGDVPPRLGHGAPRSAKGSAPGLSDRVECDFTLPDDSGSGQISAGFHPYRRSHDRKRDLTTADRYAARAWGMAFSHFQGSNSSTRLIG